VINPNHVSSAEARAHVDRLIGEFPDLCLSMSHVARLAGVHRDTLLVERPGMTIESSERLLAVKPQHVRLMPPRHISARPTLAKVEHLMSATNASPPIIGQVAGVSTTLLHNVLNGQPTVRYDTHLAVTSLDVEDVQHLAVWADREPTRRRVNALRANAWPTPALQDMTGSNMSHIVNKTGLIHATIARKVQFVYDRIGDEVGPSRKTMKAARAEGHLPPIYWNDDMTLVEAEGDDEATRAQTKARTALCILALTVEAQPVRTIVERLGITGRTISRVRTEHGLRVVQVGEGCYEPIEAWPGQIAAVRAIARDVHVWSTLDALDTPDLDYVALASRIKAAAAA
jgi:hypothetical protein